MTKPTTAKTAAERRHRRGRTGNAAARSDANPTNCGRHLSTSETLRPQTINDADRLGRRPNQTRPGSPSGTGRERRHCARVRDGRRYRQGNTYNDAEATARREPGGRINRETTKVPGAAVPVRSERNHARANDATTSPPGRTPRPISRDSDLMRRRPGRGTDLTGGRHAASKTSQRCRRQRHGARNRQHDSLPTFGFSVSPAATQASAHRDRGFSDASACRADRRPCGRDRRSERSAGSNQFDISLSPPELGRIDVQLNVDGNGHATTHMTVDRPETLALLQIQQPQLQNALEQAGLTTADNGIQFSACAINPLLGRTTAPAPSQRRPSLSFPSLNSPPIAATQIYAPYGPGGGIDIRV